MPHSQQSDSAGNGKNVNYNFDTLLIWMIGELTGQTDIQILTFFNEQVEKMLKEPINHRRNSNRKSGNSDIRLLRGFYPNTPIPFRVVIHEVKQASWSVTHNTPLRAAYTTVAHNVLIQLGKGKSYYHTDNEELDKEILEHIVLDSEKFEVPMRQYRTTTPKNIDPLKYEGYKNGTSKRHKRRGSSSKKSKKSN